MADTGLSYPPDSPYYNCSGFLNSLTQDQAAALRALQTHIISASLNLSDVAFNSLHPSLVLLRYLRANAFDVARAAEHIERNVQWRRDMNVHKLCQMQPHEILGCDMKDFTSLFPHWHCGYDKHRRPVLYKQYGGFECTELLKLTTVDAISKYHVWEQEACMRLCMLQSLKSGYLVETITAVIDVAGMHMRQVDANFMAIVKSIANIDQAQYPETLGRFYIINTPYVFPVVWRMVKAFLDPVVASKIHIISRRAEWEPALLEFIGAENLSQTYGGTAPPMGFDLHPYSEIMLSWPKSDLLTEQRHDAAPFSLASPLVASAGNGDVLNTFSPSLSSPSASTNDSDLSSGSSAYGDTIDVLEGGWSGGGRMGNVPGGTVLGILKSHEGWNYELNFLKASRERRDVVGKAHGKRVGFSTTITESSAGQADIDIEQGPPQQSAIVDTPSLDPQSRGSDLPIDGRESRKSRWRSCASMLSIVCGFFPGRMRSGRPWCSPLLVPLQSRSIGWLLKSLKISLVIVTVLSVCAMVASAYALESLRNVTTLQLELWTGLVAMLLTALTFIINLTGLFGYYLRNRKLLLMYCVSMTAIVIASTIIAIVSSVFLSSSPFVRSYRDKALSGLRDDSQAKLLLRRYNIIVCVGSSLVAVSSFFPMLFAAAVSNKLEMIEGSLVDTDDDDFFDDGPIVSGNTGKDSDLASVRSAALLGRNRTLDDAYHADSECDVGDGGDVHRGSCKRIRDLGTVGEWRQYVNGQAIQRKRSISSVLVQKLHLLAHALYDRRQLCVVVHVSLVVCLIFALAMIGYGAYAINYLLVARFDFSIFAAYSLLYCGLTLILVVVYGFWASTMESPNIIWVQKSVFIPALCIAVAATATLSLGLLPYVRQSVRDARDTDEVDTLAERKLQDHVEIQLLVAGVMGFALCFFQLVCYASFKDLYALALRIDELSRHVQEIILVVDEGKNNRTMANPVPSSGPSAPSMWADQVRKTVNIGKLGPRRHSPWATAEWIGDISRMATRSFRFPVENRGARGGSASLRRDIGSANASAALLGIDQNVFSTDAFGGTGTVRSMYFSRRHVSGGHKLVMAMGYYRRWAYLNSIPNPTFLDKTLVAWGILVGMTFIYIKGTFVIFSSWVGDDSTPSWIIALWKVMSLTDRRYSTSDDFLVSTEGFLALVIGPMALLFAWAICARSSFRHPIGVFCSTADLYTLLISIAIDIRSKFRNVSLDNLTIFVFLYLLVNIIRGLTSLFVLAVESWQIATEADMFTRTKIISEISTRRRGVRNA